MKKRFSEEQIIGFLKEAEAGVPVKELCRKHGFSDASFYLAEQVRRYGRIGCQTPEGDGAGERPDEQLLAETMLDKGALERVAKILTPQASEAVIKMRTVTTVSERRACGL